MNADGTVHAQQKISETSGGFGGDLHTFDSFGSSLGAIGDVDGKGRAISPVGAMEDDDGVNTAGALWILFLNANGTVAAEQKISALAGRVRGRAPRGRPVRLVHRRARRPRRRWRRRSRRGAR
jgi:hypothetical protein